MSCKLIVLSTSIRSPGERCKNGSSGPSHAGSSFVAPSLSMSNSPILMAFRFGGTLFDLSLAAATKVIIRCRSRSGDCTDDIQDAVRAINLSYIEKNNLSKCISVRPTVGDAFQSGVLPCV